MTRAEKRIAIGLAAVLAVMGGIVIAKAAGGSSDSGGLPACSDVWAIGKTMPRDYPGCEYDGGGLSAPIPMKCHFRPIVFLEGNQGYGHVVRWAFLGGVVHAAPAPCGYS